MRIISARRLREFYREHAGAEAPLKEWIKRVEKAEWRQFADVRMTFPAADQITVVARRRVVSATGKAFIQRITKTVVIFNVGGNNFSLIASINYSTGIAYTLFALTHAEYSRRAWKEQL